MIHGSNHTIIIMSPFDDTKCFIIHVYSIIKNSEKTETEC